MGLDPTVTYALNEADQLGFAWRRHLRQLAVITAFVALLAAALGAAGAGLLASAAVVIAMVLVWGPMWLTVGWLPQRAAVMRGVRANPLHGRSITMTLRAEGIELRIPERTVLPWTSVGRPRLGRAALEVPVRPRQHWIVPRRAFASADDARTFAAAIQTLRTNQAPPPSPTDWPFLGPPAVDVSWRTSYGELLALNRWLVREPSGPGRAPWLSLFLSGVGALGCVAAVVGREPWLVAPSIVFGVLGWLVSARGARSLLPLKVWWLWRQTGDVDARLRAGPEGLHFVARMSQAVPWAAMTRVVVDEAHVYLFFGPRWVWVLPARALPEEAPAFAERLRSWQHEAPGPMPALSDPTSGAPDRNPFSAPSYE